MRLLWGALLALVVCGIPVTAGEIFGTITRNGKPVGAGAKVEIAAGEKSYTGETDRFGAYRLFVKEKGKAALTVQTADSLSASAELFSYDRSTRYDWILEMKEGKLTIRRK
jgi:hypothetical protein